MVNRPPPRPSAMGKQDGDDGLITPQTGKRTTGPRRGLEWSLRSLHKFDTSAQHFLSNYYGDDEDNQNAAGKAEIMGDDDTAYDIFKGEGNPNDGNSKDDKVWASLHAPLRTGVVDGKKVVFELVTNVTQKPKSSREERVSTRHEMMNSHRSPREQRIRFWLMHFSVLKLSVTFLGAFIGMCVVFAGFFFSLQTGCCGDPEMPFSDTFAFSVQTATTIGYGSLGPVGMTQNFLVVMISYGAILMNTLFAGLLFTKFVTPVIKVTFSDTMVISNVNGMPCLSVRIGNGDGLENPLTDINVRLTYSYRIPYKDHNGQEKFFGQTEELKLLSSRQHGLRDPWTLRHVLDESSPLFGLHFEEHPANKIFVFTLSVDAVQELTKSTVNVQTEYGKEDVLIGHSFVSMNTMDLDAGLVVSDYSKFSETEPYPVWYPARKGAYDTGDLISPQPKSYGP